MSLYRKYRPLNFDDLKGQSHVVDILKGAIKKDKLSHAYLFTGPRGTGKTSTARIVSRMLNCTDLKEQGPCNACDACVASLEGRLTDVVEIDAASHGLVDDARALVEQARFMPTSVSKKVYIIDEVHMLSKSAFNALLKILEEPPEHVHFIMATTEAHKVLDTIQSRCQRYDFHLADQQQIKDQLQYVCDQEKVKAEDAALDLLSQQARGSFRDALSLLDQLMNDGNITELMVHDALGLSHKETVQQFLKSLFAHDVDSCLQLLNTHHDEGHDLYQFCTALLEEARACLKDESTRAQALLASELLLKAHAQLKDAVVAQLPLEMLVYGFCQSSASVQVPSAAVSAQQTASVVEKAVNQSSEPVVQTKAAPKAQETVLDQVTEQAAVDDEVKEKPVESASISEDVSLSQTSTAPVQFSVPDFLKAVPQASLRTILRLSQITLTEKKMTIVVRTEFEKVKLEKSHKSDILDLLSATYGIQVQFEVLIDENAEKAGLDKQPNVLPKKTASAASTEPVTITQLQGVFNS